MRHLIALNLLVVSAQVLAANPPASSVPRFHTDVSISGSVLPLELVVFLGTITEVVPESQVHPKGTEGFCKFRVVKEYQGRHEGTEVKVYGSFLDEPARVMFYSEYCSDFDLPAAQNAMNNKRLIFQVCRLKEDGVTLVAESNCDIPIGVKSGTEISKQELPLLEEAIKIWQELDGAKDKMAIAKERIPQLLWSKNDYIWNLAVFYQAAYGTAAQRAQTVHDVGANLTSLSLRRLLWFSSVAGTMYLQNERIGERDIDAMQASYLRHVARYRGVDYFLKDGNHAPFSIRPMP